MSEDHTRIETFAEDAYLAYAMKTVKDRAIPDVEDGLKPVQRRILYSMNQLKLLPKNAKPMKCARVVGDCFAAGTLVHAEFGLKPIERIAIGERVRAADGRLVDVVSVFENPPAPLVDVEFGNGAVIRCTPGQLFRIDDDGSPAWCRADQVLGRAVFAPSFTTPTHHPDPSVRDHAVRFGQTADDGDAAVPSWLLEDRRLYRDALHGFGFLSDNQKTFKNPAIAALAHLFLVDLAVPADIGFVDDSATMQVRVLDSAALERALRIHSAAATEELSPRRTEVVVSITPTDPEITHDIEVDDPLHEFFVHGAAVHNCIGKYHPHGDSAVYEAMVRMAQPFSLRYPLVHGEGNFGSRDGDGAAAMRYTEARLAPIAAALLDELAWDTVDYKPNYDNVLEEPSLLPARLPFLLLNGASGIAVGMATNLLSHNLVEAAAAVRLLINKPKATLDDLLEVLPGPDFPTGARLVSSSADIRSAYDTGRGSLRLRACWQVEHHGKGNKDWRLVVTELPQDTSTAKMMVAIDGLIDPKPRERDGKKLPLTPEQLRLKKMFGDLIDEVRDSSDFTQPVRLVIEPKDRRSDPEALAMALCAYTDMEMTVSPNFVCVDRDGNPRMAGLLDWLSQWCQFRTDTVRRRCVDEKRRVDARLHILKGRLSILAIIDTVIKILKDSSDPKKDLMEKFGLDDIQADDVLDMRLRQLANLEKTKIESEHAELLSEQARLAGILSDDKTLRKIVIKELDADVKAFGDERRTRLEPSEAAVRPSAAAAAIEVAALRGPEPVAVALTERGWISWRPAKSLEEARSLDYKIKQGDAVRRVCFGDRAHQLLLIGSSGRGFALRLLDLPSKADTAPLNQFFDLPPNERLTEAVIAKPDDRFLVAGSGGCGFVVTASDWMNRMKAGKAFLTLSDNEEPLPPHPITDDGVSVLALSSDGRAVGFPLADVKALPKGKGVGLLGLAPGHKLNDLVVLAAEQPLWLEGVPKPIPATEWSGFVAARAAGKKGKSLHKKSVNALFVRPGRVAWTAPPPESDPTL